MRFASEIRSIVGVRNKDWEFIVNPIVDIGFGALGEADFLPAARLARNLGEDRFIGVEYYSELGKIGFSQQGRKTKSFQSEWASHSRDNR
jgi:hypothetical protein